MINIQELVEKWVERKATRLKQEFVEHTRLPATYENPLGFEVPYEGEYADALTASCRIRAQDEVVRKLFALLDG